MTFDPLSTHCGICGAEKGEPCRPISKHPNCPPPTWGTHMERQTARMHKARNG